MNFETIIDSLKSFVIPGNWPSSIFLLSESAMADIYKCIVDNQLHSCIELGTGHGATSCVMAAAVDEIGGGQVLTIDKYLHQPVNVQVLKSHSGLSENLEAIVEKLGYNWYLADLIASQTDTDGCQPLFDFCLIDGAHEWEPDALAFSLVAKLLKPGGWIVFDDINFMLRSMPDWETHFGQLTDRELDTCQVGMVYDLVVKQHPDFCDFRVTHGGRLGWARKKVDRNQVYLQLQQTQAELQQSQDKIAAMQIQLQQTQAELQQSQDKIAAMQIQLQQTQAELQQSQDKIAAMQIQLQQTQAELQQSQDKIAAMHTSKFWKLRTAWFKLKKITGVVTEDN
uniref:class I SAM-dependent methyltransferase n=1 Tax=Trichocoleus desertorum TaxID=1481672 RepID=UPI0025B36262|nr:class I SAM-dependent methyltransferase [Trichocoleus desertorum]